MIDPNNIPTEEPTEIQAGDTVKWTRTVDNFPASAGWALSYVAINAAGKITITTTADGDAHAVNEPGATTAAWSAGRYDWQAYATKGADRYQVDSGAWSILTDYATATTKDDRTHARRTLDNIMAMLERKATQDQANYAIEGRSLSRYSWDELIEAKKHYMGIVAMQNRRARIKNGKAGRGSIGVRL